MGSKDGGISSVSRDQHLVSYLKERVHGAILGHLCRGVRYPVCKGYV